ncbi:conserved hypothetical protein [Paecilomyces variotii No. 5]|uniref:Uncharacterized protein n=1 Tax=Byssochlamys spectabilis (strain No. 5 / NBRC 109023) TaxID=1356009 RepID=V5I566_BYSSN|nr:conserved hypothetical protein [Paecilomyces variotii No. 5]
MAGAVGPRASKEEFMHALGLDANNSQHEYYYKAMRFNKDEAIVVYNHMNRDTSDLLDSLRNDPSTRPPFFWHHIRPERQRWGIVEIWRNAGPVTRPLFDRGATNGEYGPNWVTGWLLYSVFRSRDVRNNRNRRRGDDGSSGAQGSAKSAAKTPPGNVQQVKKGYYDPVRNGTH